MGNKNQLKYFFNLLSPGKAQFFQNQNYSLATEIPTRALLHLRGGDVVGFFRQK